MNRGKELIALSRSVSWALGIVLCVWCGLASAATTGIDLLGGGLKGILPVPPKVRANPCANSSHPAVWNIKREFGATGDGTTDDFGAIKAAATALKNKPAGKHVILVFPPGTYFIDRFWDRHPDQDGLVQPLVFDGISNVQIQGCDATISVRGDLELKMDMVAGTNAEGTTYYDSFEIPLTPFYFRNASNFKLAGFTIRGNAQQTTRVPDQPGAVLREQAVFGIVTHHCDNYILEDLDVGYFATDGLALGVADSVDGVTDARMDHNAQVNNVVSHHNGRTALAIFELRGGTLTDVELSYTGDTGGPLGGWSPMGGIDIEPDEPLGKNGFDQKTGQITFNRINVHDNLGLIFSAGLTDLIENITIANSTLVFGGSDLNAMFLGVPGAQVFDSFIDTKGGIFYPTYPQSLETEADTILQGVELHSSYRGIVSTGGGRLLIDNSLLVGEQLPGFEDSSLFFPYLQNPQAVVRNTRLHYPELWPNAADYDVLHGYVGLMQIGCSSGNTLETDYKDDTHPTYISYSNTTTIFQDNYISFPRLQPDSDCLTGGICTKPGSQPCQ